MKYYSEKLNKLFDSTEEVEKAEKSLAEKEAKALQLKEERTARAKEVEEAYKAYLELRSKFIKDYGTYHMTLTERDIPSTSLFDLLDQFWNF